ncbi:mevalonyl-coenzyme A hydratase sidH [Daphnia magna]|uniref:mevalonyl-coenzyme A hydratase sidH n=1 Tax=Daphnia magna TaxID=35525 RepID=UPI0006DF021C|nr:mevalonyl-coenzyme A hydratase sidH [Daphnia magna]
MNYFLTISRPFQRHSALLIKRFTSTCGNESKDVLVLKQKIGAVATIGINRPAKRNCVNYATADQLVQAFEEFDQDESVCAIVLHGIGGNFCAGYDLQELSTANTSILPDKRGPMGPSRILTKKPLIAAISGYAVAGGFELALLCDMRVMEDTAVMGVFCRRFGVPLIDGGTVRLPALVGFSRAMDLILTGRPIKAKEALEWGLVNRVVSCGTALGQAVNLADSLKRFPQECLQADRRSAYYATYSATSLEDALKYEFDNGVPILEKESVHGARKFVEGAGHHGKFQLQEIPESCNTKNSN